MVEEAKATEKLLASRFNIRKEVKELQAKNLVKKY